MYDICIIGGGPAGYVGAIRAAQLGFTVALCEERDLGGTCLNRGCVPTKALMHAADAYRSLSAMASMGVYPGQASFDYAKIHAYKQATVDALRAGIQQLLQANKVQVIQARAQVLAPGKVQAGEEILEAKHILVATGSYPSIPPIPGAREDRDVCTSDALLEEPDRFYQRLIIIGGGVIGVEMASVYAGLGCQVTIIEALDRLLPMMDREISQNLSMILKKRGISVYTGATVTGIAREEAGLCCSFTTKKGEATALGDGVLISVGRRPNTNGLFAQGCAPAMERGFIQVDAGYQSSIPGIYGVGDCNGKMQLAHAAEAQALACVEGIAGMTPAINPNVVPSCVYTDPEIACIGITADEAKAQGIPALTGKYVMNGNAKTRMEQAERSFIKLVFHGESHVLLGAQLMCPRATDMIGELACGVVNGLTAEQLLASLRPHPTFMEGVTEAVEAAFGHAIHVMPARK